MSKETTPFAFIRNHSCCQDEEEVLFTIGAIFKVQSVKKEENTWHVHLQLSKQQNQLYQELSRHMMELIGPQPSLLALGWVLYRMSEFDKAERYNDLLLKQLPSNDKEVGNIYNLLGLIYNDMSRLKQAVECYEKALDVYSRTTRPDHPQVIATHYNLGLAYLALGDDRRADEHRRQAETKMTSSLQTINPLLISMTDRLKAKVQTALGDYTSAFANLEEALRKKRRKLPQIHPSIASIFNDMGIVQDKMGNDQRAFYYFTQALEICYKCLTADHLDLAEYHANIGRICYKRKEYPSALEQFQSALNIIRDANREETDKTVTLLKCIAETEQKLK